MEFYKTLRIFVPDYETHQLMRGYYFIHDRTLVIYFTKLVDRTKKISYHDKNKYNIIYGGFNLTKNINHDSFVSIVTATDYTIKTLFIRGKQQPTIEDYVILLYNYDVMRYSETMTSNSKYYKYFYELNYLIKRECNEKVRYDQEVIYEPVLKNYLLLKYLIPYSLFLEHLILYINILTWFNGSFWKSKMLTEKQINLLSTIFVDVLLGYIFLQMLVSDKQDLSAMLMNILEELVNSLYLLLKWLMGSPAGLKLNNAFNTLLGNYFSYHVQLWWIFLNVSSEKLNLMLQVYHYIGYLGLTFQAAFICDLVSITTFHSYCIYVYAARLFNIQISGLVALLRLFVGRKYNPLRGGIDSCEYTNQELFVGTVAFTILLLLLPTTAMYYFVFTLFRLLSLLFHDLLARLMYVVQTCPVYVTLLWIINSNKIAGHMLIEVVKRKQVNPLVLRVRLLPKSLSEIITSNKPPIERYKPVVWTNVLSNILSGEQIV